MPLFGPPDVRKLERKRDVNGLIGALSHESAAIRRDAAQALGKLKDARAADSLIASLGDSWPDVRAAAADALEELKDARAVEPLIGTLSDADRGVRVAAAKALERIGGPASGRALAEYRIDDAIWALSHGWVGLRVEAARTLGELRDRRAVEPLIAALEVVDWDSRHAAAEALGQIGDARAVGPLIAALYRDWATLAMGHDGAEEFVRISDPNEILEALVRLGEPTAEPLAVALADERPGIREAAAETLERIGGPEAERALAEYRTREA